MRTFHVIDVTRYDGCATKWKHLFTKKNKNGERVPRPMHGARHRDVASKVCTQMCRVKNMEGVPTHLITVKDVTRGGKQLTKTYKVKRFRQEKDVAFNGERVTFEYKNQVHAAKRVTPSPSTECKQTPGRGREHPRKK